MSLTYAIGDVHGRRDLLQALLDGHPHGCGFDRRFRIIFLGDLIDRGPESRQCLDLAVATLKAHPGSRLILGNHEEFLLSFLECRPRPRNDNAPLADEWGRRDPALLRL
jgi:serine/threonine protein phosphatase 1